MSWTVKLISFLFISGAIFLCLIFLVEQDKSFILIQSLESKTADGRPVFNKIYYESSASKDIWMMEQSHEGAAAKVHKWDKIAIEVDKTKKPYKAMFMQLMPGDDQISMGLKAIDLKATCYMCHSNGPRVIRPDFESFGVSYWDRIRLGFWNMRIKIYGPMESVGLEFKKPFKYTHPVANQKLNVKACTRCHNDQSFFGRNFLTKQNFMSIKFMLENNLMPPPGFSVSAEEKAAVYEFVRH